MTAVGFAVAVATGWLLSRRWLTAVGGPRWAVLAFQVSLGAGIAAGLLGLLYFALLAAGTATRAALATAEAVLLAAGAILNLRRRPQSGDGSATPGWSWVLALALAAALALSLAGFFEMSRRNPEGDWDAWAIWNLRARFLASGEFWQHAWSPLLHRTHPEYPLLLPLFVARGWTYAGSFTTSVPVATALLFLLAATGLAISAAALLRGTMAGLVAGLVLVANRSYLIQGPAQYADVPLSFFLLGAVALVLLRSHVHRSRALVVASGLLAGLACWTKDEGVAFLAALAVALALAEPGAGRWLWFGAGAAPGFVAWLGFKLVLAPVATTLVPRSGAEVAARLTDPDRYFAIATAFLRELAGLGSWWAHPIVLAAVLAAAFGFDGAVLRQHEFRAAAAALALLLAAYVAVYLLTPMDLDWQLRTSLARLCAHVWPAAVLLFVAGLRLPESAAPRKTDDNSNPHGRRHGTLV